MNNDAARELTGTLQPVEQIVGMDQHIELAEKLAELWPLLRWTCPTCMCLRATRTRSTPTGWDHRAGRENLHHAVSWYAIRCGVDLPAAAPNQEVQS
jgi:hypothetical protein